ncbi:EthD family reductase [Bradyrhizobium guangxiense]
MHCLTVLYPRPSDPARFKGYYEQTHVPLAKQLPGLISCAYAYPEPLGPSTAPFCIFQAWFADAAAMGAALQSEIGAKVAADVPNYSPDGAILFHFAAGDR